MLFCSLSSVSFSFGEGIGGGSSVAVTRGVVGRLKVGGGGIWF